MVVTRRWLWLSGAFRHLDGGGERAAQQAFAAVGGRCDQEPPRLKRGRWTKPLIAVGKTARLVRADAVVEPGVFAAVLEAVKLEPSVELAANYGLNVARLNEASKLVEEHLDEIRSAWAQHFPG